MIALGLGLVLGVALGLNARPASSLTLQPAASPPGRLWPVYAARQDAPALSRHAHPHGSRIERRPLFAVGPGQVVIRRWYGQLGNNLVQLMHAIVYAEQKGIAYLRMPPHGHVRQLFSLPEALHIEPNATGLRCTVHNTTMFYETCGGGSKLDFRRALLRYVKPHLAPGAAPSCAPPAGDDFVVHLRARNLLTTTHAQSRLAPCSFYHVVIESQGFRSVRIVTESGGRHPCVGELEEHYRASSVQVTVQSQSLAADACTLMSSRHISFGLTTFAETLTLLNERIESVFVPSLQYYGLGRDTFYGSAEDLYGTLDCSGATPGSVRYFTYDIPGMEKIRTGSEKLSYLLSTPATAIHLSRSCIE